MFHDPARSGFWFHGRLTLSADALLAVDEVAVGEATLLTVAWDGLAVWSRPDPEGIRGWVNTVRSPEESRRVFQLVAAAYALLTMRVYDTTLEGWFEATNATFNDTIVGFHVRRSDLDRWPRDDRQNVAMRKAVEIVGAVRGRPNLRQALTDIHAAYRDGGDDGFLFAYRAIEDVAREVTGCAAKVEHAGWAKFHRALGHDPNARRSFIAPLTDARRAAAHGDEGDAELRAARRERLRRLDIGRVIVAEALAGDHRVPLALSDLWPLPVTQDQ